MAADWEVEYQDEHATFGNGGRRLDVVDVHFIITSDPAQGERSWVTISEDKYSADAVKALIDNKVAKIKDVHSL